jgi:hypothetical protein
MELPNKFSTIGIVVLMIISLACKSLKDCEKIKTGNFYYYAKKTREKVNIQRNANMQQEFDDRTGDLISKNKIVWKGDCKYDMFLNSLSDTKLTGDDSIIAATPAHVEIIEVKDSFYVCTVSLNIFNKEIRLKDTMYFEPTNRK